MSNSEPVTTIADPRWLRAISHPIRIRLLAMLDEEPASPVILASKLEQPLGTVAYHVRTLYDLGLLELVHTRQRRGATEHYYRTTGSPELGEGAWSSLDPISKQRLLTALIARATDLASRSAAAGGFDSNDAHLSTTALKLDREGFAQLARECRAWLERAREIERESERRRADASGDGAKRDGAQRDGREGDGREGDELLNVGLTMMLFEALPFSAALPEPADGPPAAR